MSTPKQKAEDRPISFVLHNMATGTPPLEVPLVIRPEDLSRQDVSRLAVTQTLGGAFADSFGPGVPSVQISGHTGWGAGNRKDGLQEFLNLYERVFHEWHRLRDEAIKANLDPDKVRLIFSDKLDEFTWVVAPQNFTLRRSRSRPLLAQYQINLIWVSGDVAETMSALDALKAEAAGAAALKQNGLDSLVNSLAKIEKSIADKVTKVLGPIQSAVNKVTALTAQALNTVQGLVSGALQVPAAIAQQALQLATSLTKAATNVYQSVVSLVSLPMTAKAYFQQVASAFENAFCVLSNVLHPAEGLPNYDDLYGASNCSSTSGGAPMSVYDNLNPFNVYQPLPRGHVYVIENGTAYEGGKPVPADVAASIGALSSMDPVNPLPLQTQVDHMNTIGDGLGIAA